MPGNESVGLQYNPIYDLSGGMATNYNFSRVAKNQSKKILNGVLTTDGAIAKRHGYEHQNTLPFPGNPTVNSLHILGQNANADLILTGTDDGNLYEVSTGINVVVKTGLSPNTYLSETVIDNFAFFVNGTDKPFMTQGTAATTYDVGIPIVTNAQFAGFSASDSGAAGDATAGTHNVAFRYRSTITGARSAPNEGNPTADAISFVTIVIAAGTYRFTVGAAMVSTDPQVDVIDFFAQQAGVTDPFAPYYFVGTGLNVVGNYDFGTDVSDNDIGLEETLDIDDLQPPTSARDIESWRGRNLIIVDDYNVQYSKLRVDENSIVNLPTSFPATNQLEVGFGDGDPLQKIVIFNDYVFAFKRRSVWILLGNFDATGFEFKRLKTNYTNVGLINQKCVVQAGERCFFVTDDLKFFWFSITDFSTSELRVQTPPPSDPIGNLFTGFVSPFRDFINLSNFNFAQNTQVWINFSDGASGLTASENFNSFVYDYSINNGQGGWTIFSGIEAASSVLARDNNRNYFIYTGDYYGFVWKHSLFDGDGAEINGTSTGGNYNELTLGGIVGVFVIGDQITGSISGAQGVVTFVGVGFIRIKNVSSTLPANFTTGDLITGSVSGATATVTAAAGVLIDTTKIFTADIIGAFTTIIDGTGEDQIRRTTAIINPTTLGFNIPWNFVPDNTSEYTVGGIDYDIIGRDDWCDENAPPDFDKLAWYFDLDVEGEGTGSPGGITNLRLDISFFKNRSNVPSVSFIRFLEAASLWGFAHWGVDVWGGQTVNYLQMGLNLLFKQIAVRIRNRLAGQFIQVNGWTYCYQELEHVRR